MANKKQLVAIAKKLGLDADLNWKKSEIQEAIDRAEAEIAELEAEKTTDDETEEDPEPEPAVKEPTEPVIDEPVDAAPEPEPKPELAVIEKPAVPSPVTPPEPPPTAPEPKAIPGTYKCLTGLTWQGNVYDIGDTVVMDDESAKVHVRDKSIGPVDAIQAKAERAKMLPAGDYKLVYDLTLEGHLHKMGETITLTEKQANLYEEIGVIEPR